MRALYRWKTGLAVATVSFAVGAVRLVATGSSGWLTGVWFVLAAVYAFTAVVARRLVFPERAQDWLGRRERNPRFAALLPHEHAPTGPTTSRNPTSNVEQRIRYLQHGSDETVTRTRVANALVTVAALVGLVLVFTGAGQSGARGNKAASAPPLSGQVEPAVPGQTRVSPPAQRQPPVPEQARAPAPAPTEKDNDGDGGG